MSARRASRRQRVVESMARLPKSSAEILAAARKALKIQIQPRKLKTDLKQVFKSQLSKFSSKSEPSMDEMTTPDSRSLHRTGKSMVHSVNSIRFDDPVTPQSLKAALEIKESRLDSEVERMEDLFDDEPHLHTWVLTFLTF
jgi:G3E family GTPase